MPPPNGCPSSYPSPTAKPRVPGEHLLVERTVLFGLLVFLPWRACNAIEVRLGKETFVQSTLLQFLIRLVGLRRKHRTGRTLHRDDRPAEPMRLRSCHVAARERRVEGLRTFLGNAQHRGRPLSNKPTDLFRPLDGIGCPRSELARLSLCEVATVVRLHTVDEFAYFFPLLLPSHIGHDDTPNKDSWFEYPRTHPCPTGLFPDGVRVV